MKIKGVPLALAHTETSFAWSDLARSSHNNLGRITASFDNFRTHTKSEYLEEFVSSAE